MSEQKGWSDTLTQYRSLRAEDRRLRAELEVAQDKAAILLSELALTNLKGTTWEMIVPSKGTVYLKAFSRKWQLPDEGEESNPVLYVLVQAMFPHGSTMLYDSTGTNEVAHLHCDDGAWTIGPDLMDWTVETGKEFATAHGIKLKNDPASKDELLKRIKEQADIEETARANRVALEEKLKLCNYKEAS